jgi:hypothetical protein
MDIVYVCHECDKTLSVNRETADGRVDPTISVHIEPCRCCMEQAREEGRLSVVGEDV